MAEVGPVQLISIGFDRDANFEGKVIDELARLESERMIRIDNERQTRKLDVRLYTYGGQVLLSAARLYQGQTTNFRTPGGGFAPLLAL